MIRRVAMSHWLAILKHWMSWIVPPASSNWRSDKHPRHLRTNCDWRQASRICARRRQACADCRGATPRQRVSCTALIQYNPTFDLTNCGTRSDQRLAGIGVGELHEVVDKQLGQLVGLFLPERDILIRMARIQ